MIRVSFCCLDERGNFTGKVTHVDFHEYELTVEDTFLPARGATFSLHMGKVRIGRGAWDMQAPVVSGGNIFWLSTQVRGVDALGMMNYLMRLKGWHATEGERYLYDQFNAKQFIDPRAFFASREAQSGAQA